MDKAWYITQIDVFEGISDMEMMQIAEKALEHRCDSHRQIYTPHDGNDQHVYMLKEGEVILYHSQDGKRRIFDVLGPGSIFGNFIPDAAASAHFAEALPGSRYCSLPVDDFQKVVVAHPEILMRILQKLAARLQDYEHKLHIDMGSATERVLGELKRYQKKKRNPFSFLTKDPPLAISHEKLAELTGLNRVTVTRSIKILKMEGEIDVDGKGLITLKE